MYLISRKLTSTTLRTPSAETVLTSQFGLQARQVKSKLGTREINDF
jgi:hypothetical protein